MGSDRATDIIITSRNRLEYLKRTLMYLFDRTTSSYRLHIIDDNSDSEVVLFLLDLWKNKVVSSLTLRNDRVGVMANKNLSTWLAISDPFVISADDILCPKLKPDWLSRGLEILKKHPDIMELDLNHPGAFRVEIEKREDVTTCETVGGTFGFLRRSFFEKFNLPHYWKNFGGTDDVIRCGEIRNHGFHVAFMNSIYCYHIGENSAVTESKYGNSPFIQPIDWETLEPPDEWK